MQDMNRFLALLQQAGYVQPASYAAGIGPEGAMLDEYSRMQRQGMQAQPTRPSYQQPLMQEQVPQRMPLMPAMPRRPMPQEMPASVARQGQRTEQLVPYSFGRY